LQLPEGTDDDIEMIGRNAAVKPERSDRDSDVEMMSEPFAITAGNKNKTNWDFSTSLFNQACPSIMEEGNDTLEQTNEWITITRNYPHDIQFMNDQMKVLDNSKNSIPSFK